MHKGIKMLMAAGLVLLSLGSCQKEDYKIQSNPDEFAVFPLAIPVAAEGGEYTVNITGHENWTISYGEANTTNTDWVTLSQTSGSGAAEIKVTVTQSTSFVKNRQLILEVKNETKTLRSKVIQKTLTLKDNEILIKGKVWATANLNTPGVFCESPDEIGMYYQFNSKKPWPSSGKIEGWSVDKDVFATKGWVEDAWFPENDPCPEGWRVPTTAEMAELWEAGATWLSASKTGFKRNGIVVGIPADIAATVTKDNLKTLGGLFLPQNGWISEAGNFDRTWLVSVRSATSLSDSHGGMSLGDSGGYRDIWGWGDGPKSRASSVRCVMDIQVED